MSASTGATFVINSSNTPGEEKSPEIQPDVTRRKPKDEKDGNFARVGVEAARKVVASMRLKLMRLKPGRFAKSTSHSGSVKVYRVTCSFLLPRQDRAGRNGGVQM